VPRTAACRERHRSSHRPGDAPGEGFAERDGAVGVIGTLSATQLILGVGTVRPILEDVPKSTNAGRRDRALVLIGFYGSFRRSELSALMAGAVLPDGSGVVVELATSKTSQSEAVYIPIAGFPGAELCPVKAVNAWRDGARISSGPLLRPVDKADQIGAMALSPAGVNRVVRRLVRKAGLADGDGYSAHSLGHAPAPGPGGGPTVQGRPLGSSQEPDRSQRRPGRHPAQAETSGEVISGGPIR
jgi:hypothetical protein